MASSSCTSPVLRSSSSGALVHELARSEQHATCNCPLCRWPFVSNVFASQVINAGGVLRVIPNGGEGIDVVARGTSVGVVAASKKITASWTRTG